MDIKLNPDEMRGIATQFDTAKEDLTDLINKMQGLTDTLVAGWEGEASRGYQERFKTIKDNFTNQMVPLVEEISKNLTTVANEMEDIDRKIGAQYGG